MKITYAPSTITIMNTYKGFNFVGLDKATAELPALCERQFRLLRVLHRGTLADLAEEIYEIADEDLKTDSNHRRDHVARTARIMKEDREGPLHALKLLHTIEKSVIEALILNTVGYQYATDKTFKEKLLRLEDNCHGVYLVTFARTGSVEDGGKGLARNEWKLVREMFRDYLDRDNPDEILAHRLEKAIRRKGTTDEEIMLEVDAGHRNMEFRNADIFLEKLENRMSESLDQAGTTKQLQTLCQVGCGEHLCNRTGDHDPATTMTNSSEPHALLHSALLELNIHVKFIRVVVLKTWLVEQYKVAEILITLLTSSMFIDGGLNGTGPGGADVEADEDKFKMALVDIFIRNQWTSKNRAETSEANVKRLEALDLFETGQAELKQSWKELEERVDFAVEEAKHIEGEITRQTKEYNDTILACNEAISVSKENTRRIDMVVAFAKKVAILKSLSKGEQVPMEESDEADEDQPKKADNEKKDEATRLRRKSL